MKSAFTSISLALSVSLALTLAASPAAAQAPPSTAPVTTVQTHALPPIAAPTSVDPVKATHAYLARISGPARARSDA